MTREHPQWAGTRSVDWNEAVIRSFDCVLIATAHACVDYRQLAAWARLIVDTRNVMSGLATPAPVVKC
jgi:UDP-N-acetyl-D-glucosamine dehydrogenase